MQSCMSKQIWNQGKALFKKTVVYTLFVNVKELMEDWTTCLKIDLCLTNELMEQSKVVPIRWWLVKKRKKNEKWTRYNEKQSQNNKNETSWILELSWEGSPFFLLEEKKILKFQALLVSRFLRKKKLGELRTKRNYKREKDMGLCCFKSKQRESPRSRLYGNNPLLHLVNDLTAQSSILSLSSSCLVCPSFS
jgi:hypothetical protein